MSPLAAFELIPNEPESIKKYGCCDGGIFAKRIFAVFAKSCVGYDVT